jgi:hypothetical protein
MTIRRRSPYGCDVDGTTGRPSAQADGWRLRSPGAVTGAADAVLLGPFSPALVVSDSAVAKHINAIFTKLDLTGAADSDHRRVMAVLRFLRSGPSGN